MSAPAKDELVYVALGGAGEIGMNLYLYGYGPPGDRAWMMIDLGITFGDGAIPGVDVMMADPAFIEARRDRLSGLVLSHAHEDHLGAVAYLWERLRCPIYASPFAASILRRKLAEAGLEKAAHITQVPLGGRFTVGPFALQLITLTHSIPEPNALAIGTPLGLVLHTGDWKFDPDPVIGRPADVETLRRLGDDGVLAMICDSTNVFEKGHSGSEADLLESLRELIAGCERRVAVTCFASNIARLETIAAAAAANGRSVVLAGRALRRFDAAARENGYLASTPAFLDEEEAGRLARDEALIICTGSQGEPRAALARIAAGEHANVTLEEGDTVIFSSRVIPGNEIAIDRVQNRLARRGIEIMTERDHFVHVSGHPSRPELVAMYALVRPRIAVPIHGEARHLVEHVELARECGVEYAFMVENGSLLRLAPDPPGIRDSVPTGRLALEGNRLVPVDGELIRSRRRAAYNGSVVVTLVLDGKGRVAAEPRFSTIGLIEDENEGTRDAVVEAVHRVVGALTPGELADDPAVEEAVRLAVRRVFRDNFDKRPVTRVHLVRL